MAWSRNPGARKELTSKQPRGLCQVAGHAGHGGARPYSPVAADGGRVSWRSSGMIPASWRLHFASVTPSGRLATIVELCHGLLQWSRGDIDCVRKFW